MFSATFNAFLSLIGIIRTVRQLRLRTFNSSSLSCWNADRLDSGSLAIVRIKPCSGQALD